MILFDFNVRNGRVYLQMYLNLYKSCQFKDSTSFLKKEGDVVSRDEILDEAWGADQYPTSRTIDNFILSFRKLFEPNPKEPQYFHSIRGVGYRFTNES